MIARFYSAVCLSFFSFFPSGSGILRAATITDSATQFALFSMGDIRLEAYSAAVGDVYSGGNTTLDFAYGIQRPTRNQGNFYSAGNFSTLGGLHDINGSVFSNGSISFETDFGVEVTKNATYGTTISSNASQIVDGIIAQASNSVPLIGLPNVTSFSHGTIDFTEKPGQSSVFLAPGSYRNVNLTDSTNDLHLSSGNYFMRTLQTFSSTTIHLDLQNGPINVFVANSISFDSGLDFIVNGIPVSSASQNAPSNVDLAQLVTFETHGTFELDAGFLNTFFGTVYAPFGNVTVDSQEFYGSIITGRDFSGNAYIEHKPSLRLSSVPEPHSAVLSGIAILLLGARSRRIRLAD
jgi:hypothetical protein